MINKYTHSRPMRPWGAAHMSSLAKMMACCQAIIWTNVDSTSLRHWVINHNDTWIDTNDNLIQENMVENNACKWHQSEIDENELTPVVLKLEYSAINRSMPWLLMPWLLASPGHQQPWYWQYRIKATSTRKDFSYLCYLSDRKCKYDLFVS